MSQNNIELSSNSADSNSYSHWLETHYGVKILLRRMHDKTQLLLLFLSGSAGDAVEALTNATDNFKEESIDDSMTSSDQEGRQSILLRSMHSVVTKINADLKATKWHQGFDHPTNESAVACVPDSLYMLLKWIYSAESGAEHIKALQDLYGDEDNDEDRQSMDNKAEEKVHKRSSTLVRRSYISFLMPENTHTKAKQYCFVCSSGVKKQNSCWLSA